MIRKSVVTGGPNLVVYLALSSLLARSRAPGPVVARSQRVESNKVWFDDTIILRH